MGSNFFTAKLSWLLHLPSFFNYGEQKRRQTKFKQKISPQRISSLYTGPVGLHSALRLQYLSFGLNSKLQQSVVLSQCSEQVSMSIPAICHNHHNRWLCKKFQSSVKFSNVSVNESALKLHTCCHFTHRV